MTTKTLALSVDAATLYAVVPRLSGAKGQQQRAVIGGFAPYLPEMLTRFKVTSALRIAHLLAQVAHESDSFATTQEYASGAAYEGRKDLGNIKAGDGKRFKGRGPIQLTGRANYFAFTIWMREIDRSCPDFEARPELVAEFPWAAWAAFYYWSSRNLNALADRDDLVAVTRVINGGRNGLDDRRLKLGKAKSALTQLQVQIIAANQNIEDDVAILRRGSEGEAVDQLQRGLAAAGFYLLAIDGDFGPGTEAAVKTFQRARGLVVDGIVGRETAAMIQPYTPSEDIAA
ncbi:peptidoglycan-binding protein [Rhizobium sp. Leaf341]|uniref:peptidoglycan-binding protein n=1 Tax=Rhizobium sp. Leaf341 TaxID=1736344 RepID=UPI0007139E3F|nr:peptidoglycan-binding protein [Rhizobium sp. Leaf341]KQR75763.1 peptidoglycan-binding protein [Rhizobium sp. Leaf341]